ncbi:MAG: hypothetical protein KF862_08980 [Chitinophagaceae bacterium]|nr:hypothetical protein [Chitinophagaceae bacterium]
MLGGQRISFNVRNVSADKLEVKFTAVIELTCGNIIRREKSPGVVIKPGGLEQGHSAIDGEYMEEWIEKEECNIKGNRVKSIKIENITVQNRSEEERIAEKEKAAKEAQSIADEERKRKEREDAINKAARQERSQQAARQKQDADIAARQAQQEQNRMRDQQAVDNYNKAINDIDMIKQQRNQRIEAGQALGNIIGNAIQEQQEARRQEREAEQEKRELARIEKQREIDAAIERERQNTMINQNIAGIYKTGILKKPVSVTEKINTIYYVCWARKDFDDKAYLFDPLSLQKYSDNSWPAFVDLEKKLKHKLAVLGLNDITINSYGYFTDMLQAKKVYEDIKANVRFTGIDLEELLLKNDDRKITDKDFWEK